MRKHRAQQVPTRRCTTGKITGSREFKRGVADYLVGRGLPLDTSWDYERGRQYAAVCKREGREPSPPRVGRYLNWSLVMEYRRLRADGDIL
jgi:hypothetical protein